MSYLNSRDQINLVEKTEHKQWKPILDIGIRFRATDLSQQTQHTSASRSTTTTTTPMRGCV